MRATDLISEGKELTFIDKLVENYKSKSNLFELELPKGEILQFKQIDDASEWEVIVKRAAHFTKTVLNTGHGFPEELIPESASVIAGCSIIAQLSIDPKLNERDLFYMAKNLSRLFNAILSGVSANTDLIIQVRQVEEATKLGEDSEATIGNL